jgi:hypothetical protein
MRMREAVRSGRSRLTGETSADHAGWLCRLGSCSRHTANPLQVERDTRTRQCGDVSAVARYFRGATVEGGARDERRRRVPTARGAG